VSERAVIADTGPLIAFLDKSDSEHQWAESHFKLLPAPFLTCEPVIAEAFYLLRRIPDGAEQLLQLVRRDLVRIKFSLSSELDALDGLIRKYQDLPMSLADACLVRMSEQHPSTTVFTLDKHFKIYRRNGRQAIPVTMPDAHL
jgi:predicted nucleic acid-binding protein